MKTFQQILWLLVLLACSGWLCEAAPTAEADPEADPRRGRNDQQFVVISEDVIPDVENTTQKVIRVNPLDLPAVNDDSLAKKMDSSLYKIQALLPANRNYVNSNRMRKPRPLLPGDSANSPIIRRLPELKAQKPRHNEKTKNLHFLYDQPTLDGQKKGKSMRVHLAPGAYPVYYVLAKTNGRFGKYPIKGFRNQKEFVKYLVKTKSEPIDFADRYEN